MEVTPTNGWFGEYNKTWGDYIGASIVLFFSSILSLIFLVILFLTPFGKALAFGILLSLLIDRK